MRASTAFAILAISGIIGTGCGGTYRPSHLTHEPIEEQEHVIYKNVTLKASLAVMEHEAMREHNLLKVRARFKNMMGKQINAEVKVKFLDTSGYEISDNWGWQPLIMESGEIKTFERVAPVPEAADYRILIQLAGSGS